MRPDVSPGRRIGRAAWVALCVSMTMGCTRTYYYGREAPPPIEGRTLYVDDGGRTQERVIRSIRVSSASAPGHWRYVTPDEMSMLLAGSSPDDLVEVRVDNTDAVWGNWALGTFGVTFATTFVLLATTVGLEPNGDLDLGLGLLLAAVLGLEFALVGAAVGELVDGRPVDTRVFPPPR